LGQIKRQASKSTLSSFVGILFSVASALFIIPIVPPSLYGQVNIMLAVASLALPFSVFGFNSSIKRYAHKHKTDKGKAFVITLLLGQFVINAIVCLLLYYLGADLFTKLYPDFQTISNEIIWVCVLVTLMSQFTMLEAFATSIFRLNVVRLIEIVTQKAGIPVVLLLASLAIIKVQYVIPALVLLYALRMLGLWYFFITETAQYPTKTLSIQDLNLSPIVKYSMFAFFAVIMNEAVMKIDILMVGSLEGSPAAGIYAYAFYIGMLVDLPRMNLASLLFPLISEFQTEGNTKKVNEVYKRSSDLLFVVGGFLFINVLANIDALFILIPNGETFRPAKFVIIFIAAAKVLNMAMGVNFEIISTSKRYIWIIAINSVALVSVIYFNSVLIPKYGLNGAAFATLLVWVMYNLAAFLYLRITRALSPFSIRSLMILGLTTLFGGSLYLLNLPSQTNIWIALLINSFISLGYIAIVVRLKLSSDFNQFLSKTLNRLGLKLPIE